MSALGGWLIIVGIASTGYYLGRRKGYRCGYRAGSLWANREWYEHTMEGLRWRKWELLKKSDYPPPEGPEAN